MLLQKTLLKNYVFNVKILTVKNDQVLLPNGKPAFREIVEHNGGSCVYCECEDKVLLVNQFRYAYGENLWEIPAGKLNQGEDAKQTALRELEEECGVKAQNLQEICKIYPSCGYTSEIIHLYKANGITKTQQKLDEDEFLTYKWFTKDQLRKMIDKGEIKDAKTLIALLRFL